MATDGSRLPVGFLVAVASAAAPGSAAAAMAAEQARGMPDDQQRGRLLEMLLAGPYCLQAPVWLLEAAVANGLGQDEPEYSVEAATGLVALALAHPDCGEALRAGALERCSDNRLGFLGAVDRPAVLCEAVVAELKRRVPRSPSMTPDLLKEPTPAQMVLRTARLHDEVFLTAVGLLPTGPDRSRSDGEEWREWSKRHRAAFGAWERMWRTVVERHGERHAQLVEMMGGEAANHVIRDQLLGGVPWMVEPDLLIRIAHDDLARFGVSMLVTRICRLLLDGSSIEKAREQFADELAELDDEGRREVDLYLEDGILDAEWGAEAAVSWVRHAVDGSWRLLLDPAQAKPSYGEPYAWRTPAERLSDLGRQFADVAVQALQTWRPGKLSGISQASELRWVYAMLVHLPDVTPAVRKTVQRMVDDARRSLGRSRSYEYRWQDDHRQFADLLASITRIVADPLPQAPDTRRAALGDPTQVTPRSLSAVAPDVLDDYLDRHAGDDQLMEKALLSFAWYGGHRRGLSFPEVLARHSDPQQAVHALSHDLRRRLGGNPANREAWARLVLALPDCPSETVLALPAWTALNTGQGHRGGTHPSVLAQVADALGDDRQAWQRLADSPISYSGPNAWLRLGDILTAAADGSDWPKPPASR
jgi:hypothetical protein